MLNGNKFLSTPYQAHQRASGLVVVSSEFPEHDKLHEGKQRALPRPWFQKSRDELRQQWLTCRMRYWSSMALRCHHQLQFGNAPIIKNNVQSFIFWLVNYFYLWPYMALTRSFSTSSFIRCLFHSIPLLTEISIDLPLAQFIMTKQDNKPSCSAWLPRNTTQVNTAGYWFHVNC